MGLKDPGLEDRGRVADVASSSRPLFERADVLSALDGMTAAVLEGSGRVAVVEGPAGIGKGSLAWQRKVRQEMAGLKAANLGLKFVLELVALASFAYWGASRSPAILAVILAIAVPVLFVVAWSVWAAPRSPRRLRRQTRVPFELGCFMLAAVALIVAGATVAGIAFAAVAAVNAVLLATFGQLEG